MPARRPSAGHNGTNSATGRAHRSNGSNHSISGQPSPLPPPQNLPYASSNGPATPQQKVVYALVNRLKNKLPCNSGVTLSELEGDHAVQQAVESLVELSRDSLDVIALSLTELLDKLAKQVEPTSGYRPVDVLQSQLFILKVLSMAMASRWCPSSDSTRPDSRTSRLPGSKPSTPDTPAIPIGTSRRRPGTVESLSATSTSSSDPPPLDENCAKYVLSVMVLFLRQTAPQEYRLMSSANLNFEASYHDFESVEIPTESTDMDGLYQGVTSPPGSFVSKSVRSKRPSSTSLKSGDASSSLSGHFMSHPLLYERTSGVVAKSMRSLDLLIAKFAGRIVYHLSAYNWPIVLSRMRNRIYFLASTTEGNPDIIDLQLMTHCALDRTRLVQSLQELSSLLVSMKRDAQCAIAVPIRMAIWNWIDLYPEEFSDAIRYHRRLDGAPERVFDILYELHETADKVHIWPALAALMSISPDRIKSEYEVNPVGPSKSNRKERNFAELVLRAMIAPSKIPDVALICALDICRAASRIRPETEFEIPLHSLALDIAHEIKALLWKWDGQKPVWESPDEIDVALAGDALVTVFRALPNDAIPMFIACMEPERSEAVKISAIRACTTLITEAAQLPWQPSLDELKNALSPRFTHIHRSIILRRSELDSKGNVRRAAYRPAAKRYTSETLPDRELLALSILKLWHSDVEWYLHSLSTDSKKMWPSLCVEMWCAPVDPAVKMAAARALRHVSDHVSSIRVEDPRYGTVRDWLRVMASGTIASLASNLLTARTDFQAQRMWIDIAHDWMLWFTRPVEDHTKDIRLTKERIAAFTLAEIAFLVTLSSADNNVSLTAARCLRLLAEAERAPGAPQDTSTCAEERAKCYPIYEQLGDPKVMVVGRVGHQKRIRKLLRLITSPCPLHIAVWEECYWRWCALNEMTSRASGDGFGDGFEPSPAPIGDRSLSAEEKQGQWQNLTLFLAACGSACTKTDHDPSALVPLVPAPWLPDALRVLRDPADLLSSFLTVLVDLLVSESVHVRDIAKEALSTDLGPRLYVRVFNKLDEVLVQVAGEDNVDLESLSLYLDQLLAILRVLVENIQNAEEGRGNIDICKTLRTLSKSMGRLPSAASYRLRLKYCALVDIVGMKKGNMYIRSDSETRQSIADNVIDWIQDPATIAHERDAGPCAELNIAALRTMAHVFEGLRLQAPEGSPPEEAAHVVSRLCIRYSSSLIKAWEVTRSDRNARDDGMSEKSSMTQMRMLQRDGELRELVVSGLAALISANTDFGVKHCLHLAYDPDPSKRAIFAHVFTRVLGEGIKFTSEDNQSVANKPSRICELIKGPDMTLALAVCEVCPPSEVDSMIAVLLNLFDTRSSLMSLLKTMIDLEISRTDTDSALFRSNSTCTRFLSAFAKIYGYNYLRSLIIPLIKTMTSMPPGHGYNLDPGKGGDDEDLKQNAENVKLVASSFLEIITSSVPAFPSMFREICSHIAKSVNAVWPEAKFAAVGAFTFLRFISPAIVAPETIDIEVPKDPVLRRGLMVIAKIIQNLANNIFFGKEPHMIILNDFLRSNIVTVTYFLTDIIRFPTPGPDEEADEWLDTTYDDTDMFVLHRFFEKHADKVGKELLSGAKPGDGEKPTPEAEASAANGKVVWNILCAALVELDQPLDNPRPSNLRSHEFPEFLDLMSRYSHRDTSTVRDLFVPALTSKEPAVFVLSVSKIDVELLDTELLLFYIFKTLISPPYQTRSFDIVFDFTSFSSSSQVPAQWLKFALEVIPLDIQERLRLVHILTPNAVALRYLRRLYNVTSGTAFPMKCVMHPSVRDLLDQLPEDTVIKSLAYAIELEEEPAEVYREVTMRHNHPMRVPVTLEVASSHLRITSMKAQAISNTLSCRATEIIPLTDVNDVYNVSTGHDSHEFIIRKVRQGVTLYFSSPSRDAIVKTIRAAKGYMRPLQLPGGERLSRLSNVVTTLLHVGMISIMSEDEEPRAPAYDLLAAVCTYLDYEGKPTLPMKSLFVSGYPAPYLVGLSEGLSNFAPQLTLDFLSEVATGMSKTTMAQRIICLQYMSPWIKNLVHWMNPASQFYEGSGTKLRDCIRVLIDLTMTEHELHCLMQKYIWAEVGKLDTGVVNTVLDELMRAAVDGGMGSSRCERVADTIGAISSINVRGRILARIRKVIGKTSLKPTKSLADNAHWNEIATLVRLALIAGFHCKNAVQSQLYVPETVHIVTLIAATGHTTVRTSVYGILLNMLHSVYASRLADSTVSIDVQALINECSQPEALRLFGLFRPTPLSEYTAVDSPNDKMFLDSLDNLVRLLVRVIEGMAGSKGLVNVWRARWMSLVTSSAFQLSPAVQTRAFVSLGILATSEVDDDLLYQMLVAFKTALSQSSENDTTAVVSMLRCICRVVPALPLNSRYLCQLFWLAVALLQSSHMALYIEAITLLQVTLQVMADQDAFKAEGVSATLLEGRVPLEEIACQLDQLLGLSFESSFSFSLASIIFKGVRHSGLRDAAESTLRTLLKVTVQSCREADHAMDEGNTSVCSDILGYFIALLPMSTTTKKFRQLLEDANVDHMWLADESAASGQTEETMSKIPFGLIGMADGHTVLFVTSFIGAILATAQGDDAETEILYNILSDVADAYPDIVALTYESLQDKIKDTFANSSSPSIMSSVSNLFRVAVHHYDRGAASQGSMSTLSTVDEGSVHGPGRSHLYALEELGMQGLANSFQFLPANRGHATKMINWISELVMKIIE